MVDNTSEQNRRIAELEEVLGGKYKLVGVIGSGGFGEVFLGEHTQLRRKVAIKILHGNFATRADLVERFQREARSAASLTHPNIIDIYDVGDGNGIYYFVMRYIDGETLAQKMYREKRISVPETIHIIRQLASALNYAHENDVIHRDIKPGNVMMDIYGKALLMDFGVARVQFEGNLTRTGTLLGTPHYLAPEQPLGKPVDGRSDIYSLGIMFYEMLSGRPPFEDENSISVIFKHINEPPPSLQSIVPELSSELYGIVHKMIEKLPKNRYQNAGEVAEALEPLAMMYPPPTPVIRKSTPGASRNTEQLLLLAREHRQQEKISKALEIYTLVAKRDPKNTTAKMEIEEIITSSIQKIRQHAEEQRFTMARDLLKQLDAFVTDDPRLLELPRELQLIQEASHQTETQYKSAYDDYSAGYHQQAGSSGGGLNNYSQAMTMNPAFQPVPTNIQPPSQTGLGGIEDVSSYSQQSSQELPPAIQPSGATEIWSEAPAGAVSPPVTTAPIPRGSGPFKRIALIVGLGLFVGASIIGFSHLLNKQSAPAKLENEIDSLHKAVSNKIAGIPPATPVAPKPAVGAISVTSEPIGAKVYLGDEEKGITPMKLESLPFGKYIVKFKLKGYQDFEKEVELSENSALAELPATLEVAKPQIGTLMIESTPPGAFIVLNKQVVGTTPATLDNKNAGKYQVTLKLDGYNDYSEVVRVKDGQTSKLSAQLVEIPKPVAPVVQKPAAPQVVPGSLVELTSDVVLPKAINRSSKFMEAAKKLKLSGVVRLNLLLSETGKVIDVKIVKSAHPKLDEAATKIVRDWVYSPATKQGKPVKVWLPVSITFK